METKSRAEKNRESAETSRTAKRERMGEIAFKREKAIAAAEYRKRKKAERESAATTTTSAAEAQSPQPQPNAGLIDLIGCFSITFSFCFE